MQAALEKTIYKFLGILAGAIALGTAFGICCIMSISKCCARSQKRRLEEVKKTKNLAFAAQDTEPSVSESRLDLPKPQSKLQAMTPIGDTPMTQRDNCVMDSDDRTGE